MKGQSNIAAKCLKSYNVIASLSYGIRIINKQECLMGVLRDKTIFYVTHQVEFLPAADLILVCFKPLTAIV